MSHCRDVHGICMTGTRLAIWKRRLFASLNINYNNMPILASTRQYTILHMHPAISRSVHVLCTCRLAVVAADTRCSMATLRGMRKRQSRVVLQRRFSAADAGSTVWCRSDGSTYPKPRMAERGEQGDCCSTSLEGHSSLSRRMAAFPQRWKR